jgi:glycosyltransferase involved in cell wall biosynthesis
VVIPNPLDREDPAIDVTRGRLRSQYPALAERVWILFLSRIDPKKGLDLLLPAFARLRALHPGTALIVAGDGDPGYVKSLRGLAAKLGVEADIVWTGFITGEEKRAALTDCDVFALPSYSENFGVAALDAMASGLPLVVSDQVAIHKEIAEAGAGLVVPCSEDAVLEALVATVRDAPLRFRLGRNARLAAQQFSVEKVVVRLLDLYAQTAAHGRPEYARAAKTSA